MSVPCYNNRTDIGAKTTSIHELAAKDRSTFPHFAQMDFEFLSVVGNINMDLVIQTTVIIFQIKSTSIWINLQSDFSGNNLLPVYSLLCYLYRIAH